MGYLNSYGTKNRKFQEGGAMPAPEGGAAPGQGQEEQLLALAEAAAQGDQEAAMQLGMALAPMILEQAQMASQEGAPAKAAPAEGGTPVFKRGGKFVGKV